MKSARLFFIAGPTASGKSEAALRLAENLGGEIINADAMQVYGDLAVMTARPTAQDEARAPHHLYGYLDGAMRCSAGRWARKAAAAIEDITGRGAPAIIVGGTGLYFRALEEGLSPVPETPAEIREHARRRLEEIGPEAFREEVIARDPAMARLPEGDTQRLMRAWEVFEATGRPLSEFQALPRTPLVNAPAGKVVIEPAREVLYARCDARAAVMLDQGGIEEVAALMERALAPDLPVMKALGVPEIMALLSGAIDRDACLTALQQATRRFAKRQLTWFRNQAPDWRRGSSSDEVVEVICSTGA